MSGVNFVKVRDDTDLVCQVFFLHVKNYLKKNIRSQINQQF